MSSVCGRKDDEKRDCNRGLKRVVASENKSESETENDQKNYYFTHHNY